VNKDKLYYHLQVLLGVVVIVFVLYFLPPSSNGYGTHQKLFLPPCFFRKLTGLPCPFCGATTAMAWVAKGKWLTALHVHLVGTLVFVFLLFQVVYRIWVLGGGKEIRFSSRQWDIIILVAFLFSLIYWLFKLYLLVIHK